MQTFLCIRKENVRLLYVLPTTLDWSLVISSYFFGIVIAFYYRSSSSPSPPPPGSLPLLLLFPDIVARSADHRYSSLLIYQFSSVHCCQKRVIVLRTTKSLLLTLSLTCCWRTYSDAGKGENVSVSSGKTRNRCQISFKYLNSLKDKNLRLLIKEIDKKHGEESFFSLVFFLFSSRRLKLKFFIAITDESYIRLCHGSQYKHTYKNTVVRSLLNNK